MLFLMDLIETITVDEHQVSFYNGIDLDIVMNHPRDGSKGFIFCFIENWVTEVKSWERQNKLDSVLSEKRTKKFNSKDLENSYLGIYQLQGTEPGVLFNIIKQKVINKNFPEHPWIPISGIDKGAWRIGNSKFVN